jgi:hypothetical protein
MLDLDRVEKLFSRLTIRHRDTGRIVPFRLNPNQLEIMRKCRERQASGLPLWVISVKSRRVGFSTWADAMEGVHCMAKANAKAMIMAHQIKPSVALFEVPANFAKTLPYKCRVLKKEITFPHPDGDSTLNISTAGSKDSSRGLTHSAVHCSECAYYPSDDSFKGIIPTVTFNDPDSMLFLESTANGRVGIGEPFYDYWQSAIAGRNEFMPIFVCWLNDPGCERSAAEVPDAPATDLEKEIMGKPYGATKKQIAWMRWCLETQCNGIEDVFCLDWKSLVSTQRGLVPISSCSSGDQLEGTTITSVYNRGIKPIVSVRLRNGLELRCTPDHRLLTVRRGFQEAKDCAGLAVRLGIPRFSDTYATVEVEDHGPITIDETWGEFLGYFVADGSINSSGTRPGWYLSMVGDSRDQDVKERVLELCRYALQGEPHGRQISAGAWEFRKGSNRLYYILRKLGVARQERPHRVVRVPEAIMKSPRSVVRAFLRGVFEGDGSASRKRYGAVLFSESHELLAGCQKLLLGFAITSRIKDKWLILQGEEHEVFLEEIGFIGKRKQESAKHIPFAGTGQGNACVRITMTDRVVSVENAGETEVYDISCAPEHHFQADGVIVHNCQEYPWDSHVAFITSGNPAFSKSEIDWARSTIRKEACLGQLREIAENRYEFEKAKGPWHIWKLPEEGHHYYIGCDSARGVEWGDFACISVLDGTSGETVARLAEHVDPRTCTEHVYDAAYFWHSPNQPAMVNVELTGNTGYEIMRRLRDDFMFPMQYYWKGRDDKDAGVKTGKSLGWETTYRSRERMFVTARTALTHKEWWLNDEAMVEQLENAQQTDSVYNFKVTKGHDDILMGNLLAWIARIDNPPPNVENRSKKPDLDGDEAPKGINWLESGAFAETSKLAGDHFERVMARAKRQYREERWMM